jgi:Protein of unknown function (DUF1549)
MGSLIQPFTRIALVTILGLASTTVHYASPVVDFARDVEPIIKSRCQMVTAGLQGRVMPPVGPRLTAGEVEVLRRWIDAGADWPEAPLRHVMPSAVPVVTHWAFQPIRRPTPPQVRDSRWIRNPIDCLVAAKLDASKIRPSPEADDRILARRLFLDLIGLPPSPGEVDEFLADSRPDAYEHLVDRLLASPYYGEKWTRYWLDQADYADSDGYDRDFPRPHAWRYRH